ncbi:MAG: hypothetical protein ABIH20_05310 [Candidatus Diapherotrites archaeon]
MLMLISLALFLPFVSANAQNTAGKTAESFNEGDVEGLTTNAGQLFGELSEALQLAKIAVIILGIIIIALIVLKLSQWINRPKIDKKKLKEEKEEAEFKGMFNERDKILDDLKAKLGKEEKKK